LEPHHRNTAKTNRGHARRMRRAPTDAEQKLWFLLRSRRLAHLKFRRQTPIGKYVDFVCHESRLIVEADGGQHAESTTDPERDRWLDSIGYRVIRVWNNDVLTKPDGVIQFILAVIAGEA
jgi:very-short-patch-repair endonuclease